MNTTKTKRTKSDPRLRGIPARAIKEARAFCLNGRPIAGIQVLRAASNGRLLLSVARDIMDGWKPKLTARTVALTDCPRDTDGDGDCDACARHPERCPRRASRDLRSPLARERDRFLEDNHPITDPTTLGPNSRQFLVNRLAVAFLAGARAAERLPQGELYTERTLVTPGWYYFQPRAVDPRNVEQFIRVTQEAIEDHDLHCPRYAGTYRGPYVVPAPVGQPSPAELDRRTKAGTKALGHLARQFKL